MPRQFTPEDRETVKERVQTASHVRDVAACGSGLRVTSEKNGNECCFTNLTEDTGWYVATFDIQAEKNVITLMPITEVPE